MRCRPQTLLLQMHAMEGTNTSINSMLHAHLAGQRTNLTQCAADYSRSDYPFNWTGDIIGIFHNTTPQITTHGCMTLCGTGNDWYPWSEQAQVLTTWVLPIVGIILQAPFVSNAFWETVFYLSRWIGSPICSLTYVLWNVKVTGRCALLLDMAGPFTLKESDAGFGSDFAELRDSFFLLTIMNQFTMRASVRQKKEAETLLRIALFSKDLRLLKADTMPNGRFAGVSPEDQVLYSTVSQTRNLNPVSRSTTEVDLEPQGYLNQLRRTLASEMRANRKRGVVPVFISTLWFLFSLTLSIQTAFGEVGENAEAHDLALGLLLAWLPVIILSSIVDRNLIAVDEIKEKLNEVVNRVRKSLMDDLVRTKFLNTIDREDGQDHEGWLDKISGACPDLHKFFVHFAGQGRKRYHYGAAHPILVDIESAYIAEQGRDWLRNEEEARSKLVLGDSTGGLDWLDPRELWQVLSAVLIVGGATVGAFVISYFTPTVGLGCRSGGYMIFGTVAFGLLLVELVSWWVFDASKVPLENFRRHTVEIMDSHWNTRSKRHRVQHVAHHGMEILWRVLSRAGVFFKRWCPQALLDRGKYLQSAWQGMPSQKRLDYWFFKPAECGNTIWLFYIVMAQTTGSYNSCDCKSSNWAGGGGYVSWNTEDTAPWSEKYWISGTVLSTTTMAIGMIYIVIEWCLQSHLSTANVESAARGLQRTRHFRWLTSPYRTLFDGVIQLGYNCRLSMSRIGFRVCNTDDIQKPRANRRSLRWTKEITRHAVHRHDRQVTPPPALAVPSNTRGRADSGSDILLLPPQIIRSDSQGRQVTDDTDEHPLYRYADTPSPRSSDDHAPSPTSGWRAE